MVNIKNIILGIAIIILTICVAVYGVHTFYEVPEYEDFCGRNLYEIKNQADCTNAGGVWNETEVYDEKGKPTPTENFQCREPPGCYTKFDEANEKYSKTLFLITLPLGLILIAIGVFFSGLETVGAGLSGGGVGIILWGVLSYWRYGSDLMRLLLSAIGLIIVVSLAYMFNKKREHH